MARKWILLNLLLLVAALGLARELYRQYERFETNSNPVKINTAFVDGQTAAKAAPGASADASAETPVRGNDDDYLIIAENTLFSETRGRREQDTEAALQSIPPLNPKPLLVGTVMIDGQYVASVIDPATQNARGGNVQINTETRRVGDVYRGYQITSIEAEQMVLENGGRREVIQLTRNLRRQTAQPARSAAAPARVVPIGPGGKSSGSVVVTTAGIPAPGRTAPGRTARNIDPAVEQAAQNAAENAARQAYAQTTAQAQAANQNAARQAGAQTAAQAGEIIQENTVFPAQTAQPRQETDAQSSPGVRQRVIRSPFGDITRPGLE